MTQPAPFALQGIDHIVIRCRDLEAMTAFYCGVLGCTVDRDNREFDLRQIRVGRQLVDLIPVDGVLGRRGGAAPGPEGRNLDHFAIRIEPFEEPAIRDYLTASGIDVVEAGPRYGAEGTGPSIYVRDPEGNTVELKGPPSPAAG